MHTDHSHDCATPVEVLLATAREQGLGAIAVTDHNEVSGAFEAREKAAEYGVKIIVAEEVKTANQGEVIGLFIEEKIPRGLTLAETVAEIKRQGGLVYVPHPFDRMHAVPDYEHLLTIIEDIDAIEVYNPRVAIGSFNEEAAAVRRQVPDPRGRRIGLPRRPGLGSVRVRMHDFDGAGGVPRVAAHGRDHDEAVLAAVRAGAEVPRDEGHPAERAAGRARAAGAAGHAQVVMHAQGRPSQPSNSPPSMPTTDDEIREKYLERAIRELNTLTRELQDCHECPRGHLMPVLGSGHPQADILLLKHAPTPPEIEEGVAFYGRAGAALMKAFKRLAIDPLAVYGTLCVKCPVPDTSLADPACVGRVAEEIAIVQPKMIVVMGEDALDVLNDLVAAAGAAGARGARRGADADAVDRGALRAEHRRGARRGGRQARVLVGLPGARRVVRGPSAVLSLRRAPPGARARLAPTQSGLEDDLAELAAGGEALVGRGDVVERERLGDRHRAARRARSPAAPRAPARGPPPPSAPAGGRAASRP